MCRCLLLLQLHLETLRVPSNRTLVKCYVAAKSIPFYSFGIFCPLSKSITKYVALIYGLDDLYTPLYRFLQAGMDMLITTSSHVSWHRFKGLYGGQWR